jgi:mono/diheme cytochrome c family protein
MIVQRGFTQPPSLHDPAVVAKPVGHYYNVMTNGWGAMYSYADRVPPEDRWAIAAYIRALQYSRDGRANGQANAATRPAATPPTEATTPAPPTGDQK